MYVVHARFSRNDVRVYFFVVKKKELGRLKEHKKRNVKCYVHATFHCKHIQKLKN